MTGSPDLSVPDENEIPEGKKTTKRLGQTGTHDGEIMDIPPTEEAVDSTAIGTTRWEDGEVVEHWSQTDLIDVMEQLGVR